MIIGYPSKAMHDVMKQLRLAARSASNVLLTGESGSGKDFIAKLIHDHSERSSGPFEIANCASFAENLIESELFGYERGAFTGAGLQKKGRIELAERGTLVLNEIGELPVSLQTKLLTFLDTKTFYRVGGQKEVEVDVRIIAATNRDVLADLENGNFRTDLYYRLNVIAIHIPPLRDRKEDLPTLVAELLKKLAKDMNLAYKPLLEPDALDVASAFDWPGNVRQLGNVLERCLLLAKGPAISAEIFTDALKNDLTKPDDGGLPPIIRELRTKYRGKIRSPSIEEIRKIEQKCIDRGMNQQEIATAFGVSQPTISRWLKRASSARQCFGS
jgi:transcriptional regulator with PAS, ATPase and Fis domain